MAKQLVLPLAELGYPIQTLPPSAVLPQPIPDLQQLVPQDSILDRIKKVYNYFLPALNFLLYSYGYLRFPKGMPVSEQMAALAEFSRGMTTYGKLLDKEREDLKNAVKGVLISQGVDPEDLAPGTPAGRQIDETLSIITSVYPLLYIIDPNLITYINPRSSFPLAQRLNHLFARNMIASPDKIRELSEKAAETILNDYKLHQGLNTVEIGELAEQAAKSGLLSFDNADKFVDSLAGVIAIAAPLKEEATIKGQTLTAKELADLASRIVTEYPAMTDKEIGLEQRRRIALERRGGEYRMLALYPEGREYLRRAGVPVEELEKQHATLKEQARHSLFGAALGAIARGVKEGVIRPGSPAYYLYQKAQNGEPLDVVHPNQLYQAMIRSGMEPQVAAALMMTPEESSYWLTPQMTTSIRLTQFYADWLPRFEMLRRFIPGSDPQSVMLRDAAASRLVRQAGYKNIHHFLALHGPVATKVPEIRRAALNEAAISSELAGYEQYQWGGLARAVSKLQDIGKGKEEGKFSLGDLLGPLAEIYKTPEISRETGLNYPRDPRYISGYKALVDPHVIDILEHDKGTIIPSTEQIFRMSL